MDVQRIESNVRDSVGTAGLIVAEYTLSEPRRMRLVIDSDRGVTMQDCVRATRAAEEGLRASGYDPDDFTIQVESPGVDRKLLTDRDFERYRGQEVRVTMSGDVQGRTFLTGVLGAASQDEVVVIDPKREWRLARRSIKEIRLNPSFGRKRA
jgi:ribosome maturation factor RimP